MVLITSIINTEHTKQLHDVPIQKFESSYNSFIAYKGMVENYVQMNRSFNGSVPNGDFDTSLNNIIIKSNYSTIVFLWKINGFNLLDDTLIASEGNKTIGYSMGNHWYTKSFGDMGLLPVSVPDHSMVSVVLFSGNGF